MHSGGGGGGGGRSRRSVKIESNEAPDDAVLVPRISCLTSKLNV